MAAPTTVSTSDIARIADVGRATVTNWRRRHSDFPAPTGGTESRPTFTLEDVEGGWPSMAASRSSPSSSSCGVSCCERPRGLG